MRSEPLTIENAPVGHDGLGESIEILSSEMNARLSQEMESLLNLMQTQINRAISSAENDSVLSEIQNMCNLPLDQNYTGTGTYSNELGFGNVWKDPNTKFTKEDSSSSCDLWGKCGLYSLHLGYGTERNTFNDGEIT